VVNQASTTLALTSTPNPSTSGQAVTLTATISVVSPGAGNPTGTVAFMDNGSTTLGTASLTLGGTATFTTTAPLSAGSHSITAVYNGDIHFAGSTSSALTQTVTQSASTVNLTNFPNSSVYGQPVTFTASVGAVAPGGG